MHNEINYKIKWRKTPQGFDYWDKWYCFLLDNNITTNTRLGKGFIQVFIIRSTLPIDLHLPMYDDLVATNLFGGGDQEYYLSTKLIENFLKGVWCNA